MENNNILIIGPPGCGKTYSAQKRSIEILWQYEKETIEKKLKEDGKEEYLEYFNPELFSQSRFEVAKTLYYPCIKFVSLHEGYSYNDFVEGISIETDDGKIKYKYIDKVIKNLIREINKRDITGILILDDIQRVNISSVFGELLNAIENRNTKITLPSGEMICVPNKLHIIATMSTIDQKFKTDYALMRRFNIEIRNTNETILRSNLEKLIPTKSSEADEIIDKIVGNHSKHIEGLYNHYNKILDNTSIDFIDNKSDYSIGYTYFLPPENTDINNIEEVIQHKIRHQVIPLLEQYSVDGIIDSKFVPNVDRTNTKFTRDYSEINEEKINVVEDKETSEFSYKIYINGEIIEGKDAKYKSTGNKINRTYLMVYEIIKDIINNPLINTVDIIDILVNNKNIICTRDDIVDGGGGFWVDEEIADRLVVKDSKPKNQNVSFYYQKFHRFNYGKIQYRMVSKFKPKDNCSFKLEDCYVKKSPSQHCRAFNAIKLVVYYYLKAFESNLKKYIKEASIEEGDIAKKDLDQLTNDILIVEKITNNISKNGEVFYYNSENYEVNFVELIRSLATWKRMKSGELKGVYKKMDKDYQKIMENTGIHQMILQGPPGTSKTYGAKEFLCLQANIINNKGELWKEEDIKKIQLISDDTGKYSLPTDESSIYWDIVQFHPSYCYEDFVRGISVATKNNSILKGKIHNAAIQYDLELENSSNIVYKTVNRTLGKMAELAQNNKDKKFYLIIDEINRANLATVFGELIYALEYRNSSVATPYQIEGGSSELIIPNNMFIIGTMNTADKSIGTIDYAIRRRFLFFPVLPDINIVIKSINHDNPIDALEVKLFYAISKLFDSYLNSDDYNRDDVQIGHTYFIRKTDDETTANDQMKDRFLYQVIPVLREYIKDGVLNIEGTESNIKDELKIILKIIMDMCLTDNLSKIDELYNKLEELISTESYINIIKSEIEA